MCKKLLKWNWVFVQANIELSNVVRLNFKVKKKGQKRDLKFVL